MYIGFIFLASTQDPETNRSHPCIPTKTTPSNTVIFITHPLPFLMLPPGNRRHPLLITSPSRSTFWSSPGVDLRKLLYPRPPSLVPSGNPSLYPASFSSLTPNSKPTLLPTFFSLLLLFSWAQQCCPAFHLQNRPRR